MRDIRHPRSFEFSDFARWHPITCSSVQAISKNRTMPYPKSIHEHNMMDFVAYGRTGLRRQNSCVFASKCPLRAYRAPIEAACPKAIEETP